MFKNVWLGEDECFTIMEKSWIDDPTSNFYERMQMQGYTLHMGNKQSATLPMEHL